MTKRLCISVSDDDSQFLEVNNISPSRLLQDEIKKIRSYDLGKKDLLMKIQAREDVIMRLNEKIMLLQEKIDVLEKK